MKVTLYKRPNGTKEVIDCKNIDDEDAKWFEENNIPVSMEGCGGFYAVYADCGFRVEDDESEDPDEIIMITTGDIKTCEELMAHLRTGCEKALTSDRPRFNTNASDGITTERQYNE